MTHAEKECYDLFQEIGLLLHPACRRCGAEATAVHHIRPRAHKATAFDPDNGWSTCAPCHKWVEEHPKEAEQLIRGTIGAGTYDFLVRQSAVVVRMRQYDYLTTARDLRRIRSEILRGVYPSSVD